MLSFLCISVSDQRANQGPREIFNFRRPLAGSLLGERCETKKLTEIRNTDMKIRWLYRQGNKTFGPVSSSELKQLANAGELKPDDLVSKDGTEKWAKAKNVKGLISMQPTPPPIQPPTLPLHDQAEEQARQVVSQPANSNQNQRKLVRRVQELSLSSKLASGGCLLAGVFFLICCGGLMLPFGSKTWTAQELATLLRYEA